MARKTTNTVDYFPHVAKDGRTIAILENKFGNDGYAFLFKLFSLLSTSENHFYDASNAIDWEYFLSKAKVSQEIGEKIMIELIRLDIIDGDLWSERVIWSQKLVNNFSKIYDRRGRQLPIRPIISNKNAIPVANNPINKPEIPQSIVKHSIAEQRRVESHSCAQESNSLPQEFKAAEYLFSHILKNDPKAKKPNLEKWASEIEKLNRIDNRDFVTIKKVIDFSQADPFWKSNILSAKKLRDKFPTLFLQMQKKNPTASVPIVVKEKCEYCGDMVAHIHQHWDVCPQRPSPASPDVVRKAMDEIKSLASHMNAK